MSLADEWSEQVWPGVRQVGLAKAEPGAGAGPGGAARGAALIRYGSIQQRLLRNISYRQLCAFHPESASTNKLQSYAAIMAWRHVGGQMVQKLPNGTTRT
jgi:hypothetical protein